EVADERRDGPAGDDRHREEDLVVLARPAQRGEDVRVLDADRLLADEAQQRGGVDLAEHLGGDVAALPVVPRAPDDAGATLTEGVDQLVPARERLTHGAHPMRRLRGWGRSSQVGYSEPAPDRPGACLRRSVATDSATGPGSSVGTSVRLKIGRSAVRPRPWPQRRAADRRSAAPSV